MTAGNSDQPHVYRPVIAGIPEYVEFILASNGSSVTLLLNLTAHRSMFHPLKRIPQRVTTPLVHDTRAVARFRTYYSLTNAGA